MSHRMNRHAQMRRHKRKLKEKYGRGLYTGYRTNPKLMEEEYREKYVDMKNARNGGYEYWQSYYLTGPRKYAKETTNGVIRAMYRALLSVLDPDELEDVQALKGSDYEKTFDYDWTIW